MRRKLTVYLIEIKQGKKTILEAKTLSKLTFFLAPAYGFSKLTTGQCKDRKGAKKVKYFISEM
jgi:sugar phosphate permease